VCKERERERERGGGAQEIKKSYIEYILYFLTISLFLCCLIKIFELVEYL